MREYTVGTYGITPYILSKLASEMPLNFVRSCLFIVILHSAMGYQGTYIHMVPIHYLLLITSSGLAMVLGSAIANVNSKNIFLFFIYFFKAL